MSTLEIGRDEHRLEQFLINGDPRQVWTRTRDTGAVFYLEDGHKANYDASNLACIVRECDGPITLVEGELRTHYRHISSVQHRRSLSELYASAAAVEAWAAATGREPLATAEHRDAEIISVIGPEAVTYVVVSEKLPPEAWRNLRSDVAANAKSVQWFLWAGMLGLVEADDTRARLPKVAELILQSGDSVLVVNPESREIGTLVSAGNRRRQPSGKNDQCIVSVCSIDDCEVDSDGLMVTPTMAEQRRWAEDQKKQKARQNAARAPTPVRPGPTRPPRAVRPASLPNRSRVVRPAGARSLEPTAWNAEEAWEMSESRRRLLERFGEPLPALLTHSEPADDEVGAMPAHWHCVLYLQVLEPMRRDLAVETIIERLARHEWPAPVATAFREGRVVHRYLEFLAEQGVLRRVGTARYELARKIDGAQRRPQR